LKNTWKQKRCNIEKYYHPMLTTGRIATPQPKELRKILKRKEKTKDLLREKEMTMRDSLGSENH